MNTALFGYTGFVGQNLNSQKKFDEFYNSSNVKESAGKIFDLVVYSGTKAEKWRANQNPDEDQAHIDDIISNLKKINAHFFVLISTVDVFPDPRSKNESSVPEYNLQAYGRNRRRLEEFVQNRFPQHLVVRLTGNVGAGLKKNIVFDFLNQNQVEKINSDSVLQFYDLSRIWSDIQKAIDSKIKIIHLAPPPIKISDLANICFGLNFHNNLPNPVTYDLHTLHAALYNNSGNYIYSEAEMIERLKAFVSGYKK